MFSGLSAVRRSASGAMASQFMTLAKADVKASLIRSSVYFAARRTIDELNGYFSSLRPFTPPSPSIQGSNFNSEQAVQDFFRQIEQQSTQIPRESIMDELEETNVMHMTSVLRKRKIKMRKHKYKKLRKRTRALRKKLGK
ncbi:hypothetical protein BGZ49_005686 [Haplosporangium sp. Z 27]|nr:hypothetical protein BGZ49_005686 [Haplosporangium sp. Z 27]